jgi:DNA-binding response OmpR family regulator
MSGYDVVLAESGSKALRLFHSRPIDAVILSYELAGMQGSEVAAAIKGVNPAVPIVMISACASVVEEAPRFVDAALVRESQPGRLLEKLERLLNRGVVKRMPLPREITDAA